MTRTTKGLTAAQIILLAASDLAREGKDEFTEWELTIAAWKRDENRFGLRGFEDQHPDHKRVMMEIMGQTKRDNPIRRKFMAKTKPNHYRLTELGHAEASVIDRLEGSDVKAARSPQAIYNAIKPYVNSKAFQSWLADPDEPKSWLGASSFLGLRKNTTNELNDRIRAVNHAVLQAEAWCDENDKTEIRSGASGGERAIALAEIQKIPAFVEAMEQRFERQMGAIRQRE
ncbi:MAG: hypothetical protein RIB32_04195 [Phycisphaerales bacterium]